MWIVDPDRGNRAAFNKQMIAARLQRAARSGSTARPPASSSAYKGRLLVYTAPAAA